MMRITLFRYSLLALMVVASVGCNRFTEEQYDAAFHKIEEASIEGDATVDSETGDFATSAYGQEFATGSLAELPEGWPDDIPMPDSYELTSAGTSEDGELSVTISPGKPGEELYNFYRDALPEAGWQDVQELNFPGSYTLLTERGGQTLSVAIYTPGGDDTAIVALTLTAGE